MGRMPWSGPPASPGRMGMSAPPGSPTSDSPSTRSPATTRYPVATGDGARLGVAGSSRQLGLSHGRCGHVGLDGPLRDSQGLQHPRARRPALISCLGSTPTVSPAPTSGSPSQTRNTATPPSRTGASGFRRPHPISRNTCGRPMMEPTGTARTSTATRPR